MNRTFINFQMKRLILFQMKTKRALTSYSKLEMISKLYGKQKVKIREREIRVPKNMIEETHKVSCKADVQ